MACAARYKRLRFKLLFRLRLQTAWLKSNGVPSGNFNFKTITGDAEQLEQFFTQGVRSSFAVATGNLVVTTSGPIAMDQRLCQHHQNRRGNGLW